MSKGDEAKLAKTIAECERLRKLLRDLDAPADKFRIVEWCPGQPETKQPAGEQVFTDLMLAEKIKAQLGKDTPHRCFAVEPIKEESPAE